MPARTPAGDVPSAVRALPFPIPRGIAFCYEASGGADSALAAASIAVATMLPTWTVREAAGLAGWYEAIPPPGDAAGPPAPSLGAYWEHLRALRDVTGVTKVEPLLAIDTPQPTTEVAAESFAMGFGQEQFGLWGWPYDADVERAIAARRRDAAWHLAQMRVPAAWDRWRLRHPGREPGAGALVGHPDTGYSEHPEVKDRFRVPGWSFQLDAGDQPILDAIDQFASGGGFLQAVGHGTATASVIAGGGTDVAAVPGPAVFGVAPGAEVLPLRVSDSVIHFDFGNVARAIAQAVAAGADVISMSLGGPGYSAYVREAIALAHANGLIVVSAAGNLLPSTVFPAAFPEVIAVAATHAAEGPWRFSGFGRLVDIAAPGEDVWSARAASVEGRADYSVAQSTGTSFATACVAGVAALWLSFHGGRDAVATTYGGDRRFVPFAFQYLLARTANNSFDFVRKGKHGAGIVDADALLRAELPDPGEVARFEQVVREQAVSRLTFVTGLFSGGLGVTDRTAVSLTAEATVDADGRLRDTPIDETAAVRRAAAEREAEKALLVDLLGEGGAAALSDELLARIAADRQLLVGFQRWRQGESVLPLLDRLLAPPPGEAMPPSNGAVSPGDEADIPPPSVLSEQLWRRLVQRRSTEADRLLRLHPGSLVPPVSLAGFDARPPHPREPEAPPRRRLRAYAFDPSLETDLETAQIHQVTIPTRWETLRPGPIGEYLEVVDVDPASGCAYSPVDLDHPHLLGQDGSAPSEGNPQFHQQMVYAVAMNTVDRFELALGRPIFWSALRPWLRERPEERHRFTPEALAMIGAGPDGAVSGWVADRDRYVQRLRVYPHALREANAYYSPDKRALLFGYFPANEGGSAAGFPEGMVFTCLSHDIIAHETTHALLDGMHPYFNEPSNEDVWAFHEAFADIMALFQHFTYPEVLRHQIAANRGDLETGNLLGQLAQQFGRSTGGRGALRDAIGGLEDGVWKRHKPDPRALGDRYAPHDRGSILVAAVFDAFLALYEDRIADLLRIATGGSGVLPTGQLHPDLVNRLAVEAAQTAEEILRVCIRAMDYVPPVDITFGEFLRALITADYELTAGERRRTRVAFIDAFRSWGIYPRDVSVLSEESLRWRGPAVDDYVADLTAVGGLSPRRKRTLAQLAAALESWQPGSDRYDVFEKMLAGQRAFHALLQDAGTNAAAGQWVLPGLDLRDGARFTIANLRPARRVGLRGEFRTEMVVEVVQRYRPENDAAEGSVPFRGGATLVVDTLTWRVRYVIYKRLYAQLPSEPGRGGIAAARFAWQERFAEEQRSRGVAALHAAWQGEATDDAAAWLAATYACRERRAARRKRAVDEPFALLHRGIG